VNSTILACSNCSWQYGVQSPSPSGTLYGGFVRVKMPSSLPSLNCLYVIWASVSSANYFYQTSLGYSPSYGWHISAGSTNPGVACDLACPPFQVGGSTFRPQPGKTYEIGIRFVPQTGGSYQVHLYFVDVSSGTLYDIYVVTDSGTMTTPVGGILESYDIDNSDLNKLGNGNCLEVVNANWLTAPYVSAQWPHGYVYGPTTQTCKQNPDGSYSGYQAVPGGITINKIASGDFKIGYQVGGSQYQSGYQLW